MTGDINELIQEIRKWQKDLMSTQPHNLQLDTDTFEGSAYVLMGRAVELLKENKSFKHLWLILSLFNKHNK